jgi:hypothetical protein
VRVGYATPQKNKQLSLVMAGYPSIEFHRHMTTKQAIVDSVLGACVPYVCGNTLFKTLKFRTYEECVKPISMNTSLNHEIAFLVPDNAMLVAVENNATLGIILHVSACDDYYFRVQPEWAFLAQILPLDSIFEGILYLNRVGQVQIGFFDVLLFFGIAQTDCNIMQRHQKLFTFLHDFRRDFSNTYHWIGYAKTCFDCIQTNLVQNTLPFEHFHMVVLSDDHKVLRRIVNPIKIPSTATNVPVTVQ